MVFVVRVWEDKEYESSLCVRLVFYDESKRFWYFFSGVRIFSLVCEGGDKVIV